MVVAVSVVVPLFNEVENVEELVRRVAGALRAGKDSWELVAVDDGSTDGTAAKLQQLAKKYKELKPVLLCRNYGQSAAMQAGFDHAQGDIVVTMDGDLQNDPADVPALVANLRETGADIVSGWRKNRKDAALKRNFPSKIANFLIARITGVRIHDYGCSLKAYRGTLVHDLKIYGELHRFIPAIAAQYGARVEEMVVSHAPRLHGKSKYGIDRTIRVALDIIQVYFFQKYLHRPLHFFGYFGLLCLVPGLFIGAYLTALKLFGESIGGRPLLLLGVLLVLIGVQLLGMGLLAELLVRIYHEPGGRRQYQTR